MQYSRTYEEQPPRGKCKSGCSLQVVALRRFSYVYSIPMWYKPNIYDFTGFSITFTSKSIMNEEDMKHSARC